MPDAEAPPPKKNPNKEPSRVAQGKDSFFLNSVGKQIQSQRTNAAKVAISECGREKREKVFISKEASNSVLPTWTPPPGAYETHQSTLHIDKGSEGIRFGTGPKSTFGYRGKKGINFFPDSSLDIEKKTIDNTKGTSKYPRFTTSMIGTEPTGLMNNINLLKNHAAAFVGQDSPGPQYALPPIDKMKEHLTWAVPFGIKSDVGSMFNYGTKTPPGVGPNSYPPMTSFGTQKLSQRRNPTTYRFNTQKKFGPDSKKVQQAPIEVPLSSFGKQVGRNKRTEQTVGFSFGTRAQAQRIARCMHPLDAPGKMNRVHLAHPALPAERAVINHSGSMAAIR